MGVEVRKEVFAEGEVKKIKCKCFLFPPKEEGEPARLCFRKNYVGALNDEQIEQYCDAKSLKPESEGGTAKDANSQEVVNLVRTINEFSAATARAKNAYAATGKRDMNKWRETVATEMSPNSRLTKAYPETNISLLGDQAAPAAATEPTPKKPGRKKADRMTKTERHEAKADAAPAAPPAEEPKEKKPRTPAQIAATKRMLEARAAKQAEREKAARLPGQQMPLMYGGGIS